jgi:DNA polymerase-3 subunit delta'
MALRPVYGHAALRARLGAAAADGRLPASLLLQGARGVGKQRLALWLAQRLLCSGPDATGRTEPCGDCQHCRYAERGMHPDLHWYFPRPRLRDGDAGVDDVAADIHEAIAERMEQAGLWGPPSGMEGIHVATVRAIVQQAARRPAMATRAVFVIGDAERMVPQESSPEAANALLKLLEEPPPGTTLILTSSEPGALLPTIRSRVVSVRVPTVPRQDMEAFLDDPEVARRLSAVPRDEALARAAGAPGVLFAGESMGAAFSVARRLLDAALQPASPAGTAERTRAAARLGVAGARGAFTDTLDALTVLLRDRTLSLVTEGRGAAARRTAATLVLVEQAKAKAQGNVSPQLLGSTLLSSLNRAMVP